jgi:hypothetical protein
MWDVMGDPSEPAALRERLRILASQPSEADRELVDEAVALGILDERQRDPTLRLLVSAPDETRELLDDMGMRVARDWDLLPSEKPPSPSRSDSSDDLARVHELDLAARLCVDVKDLV